MPEAIEHAAPDVELAEAQLAAGRPEPEELLEEAEPQASDLDEPEPDETPVGPGLDDESDAAPARLPVRREPAPRRLINFAQGSWRELQRVQWPDRRQVMQATGVVIGFVIVAGVFLGVADFFAGKVMNYVLTGHFK
jgi:preprotein translocase subunit SecE